MFRSALTPEPGHLFGVMERNELKRIVDGTRDGNGITASEKKVIRDEMERAFDSSDHFAYDALYYYLGRVERGELLKVGIPDWITEAVP
jgi:hypothetical protein